MSLPLIKEYMYNFTMIKEIFLLILTILFMKKIKLNSQFHFKNMRGAYY